MNGSQGQRIHSSLTWTGKQTLISSRSEKLLEQKCVEINNEVRISRNSSNSDCCCCNYWQNNLDMRFKCIQNRLSLYWIQNVKQSYEKKNTIFGGGIATTDFEIFGSPNWLACLHDDACYTYLVPIPIRY